MAKLFSFIIVAMLFFCGRSYAQGYIIKIDGDRIYLSMPNAKVSDIVSVFDDGGYTTDPRTGQGMRIEPEAMGQIKIIAVQGAYAVGKVYGDTRMPFVESMTVRKDTKIIQRNDYGEVSVIIAPAELMFPKELNTMVDGGYIGDYVSAALIPHLLKSGKIQLIDHSLLTPQQNNYGESYSNSAVNYAKEMGARYMVKVTMLKPDVDANKVRVRVSPGKVFDGISRLGKIQGENAMGTVREVLPENMAISNMKVSVKMLVHLVDLQTGKILNMWEAEGIASGKSTIDLQNMPALGDLFIGGSDFTQTVTGQAIDKAFEKIGKELNKFFDEKISK